MASAKDTKQGSPPSGGESGGSGSGDTLPPDPATATAIKNAEAIAHGKEPADLPSEAGSTGVGSDPATPEPTPPPTIPLGGVIVCLTDHLFCLAFGDGAGMRGELRGQTEQAWDAVIKRYLPRLHTAGPVGALALCYVAHAAPLIMGSRAWTKHEKPLSPGSPGAENQPS